MPYTDEEILNLIRRADTQQRGFRLLIQTYQERLYWHIRRMVTQHEDANDVVQNCLIKVYRSIDKFKGDSKLYTWLYRIATNEAITFLNKKKRVSVASIDDEQAATPAQQLQADVYFDGNEAQRQLQLAIQQLPKKQRAVFNLRYFDEMTYADIAAITGTSVGGLKASYHHAVKKVEAFILNG
ncbi:MAG: sigma-70 family RNA polymerase sigma factor [Bacteroidota bacterium]